MQTEFKDWYQILGVAPNADLATIKRAFRRLAHLYHPDKQQQTDEPQDNNYFLEIQEAYSILSDEKQRTLFDKERWLHGIPTSKIPQVITASYLLDEVDKLFTYLSKIETNQIDKDLLADYLEFLLKERHIDVLNRFASSDINTSFINAVLLCSQPLLYQQSIIIFEKLLAIKHVQAEVKLQITKQKEEKYHTYIVERRKPWLIALTAILVCLIVYILSKY